jgi:hypothetical protein
MFRLLTNQGLNRDRDASVTLAPVDDSLVGHAAHALHVLIFHFGRTLQADEFMRCHVFPLAGVKSSHLRFQPQSLLCAWLNVCGL